jgi:predicted RNase H-related nuclease YkuK (DUF458 family)
MFVKRNITTNEKELTDAAKLIIAIFTIISMIAGAVFYFENTYMHKADAKELQVYLEKNTVQTFQQLQKSIQTQQQLQEQTLEMRELDNLRDLKVLLEENLKKDPNNPLLKNRLEIIKTKIRKLEDKIYGQ